jgi:hypothetical protein
VKTLCLICHYYDPRGPFVGGSATQTMEVREAMVRRCHQGLKSVNNIDLCVVGVNNKALIPLDQTFDHLSDPRLLVYEALDHLKEYVKSYEYLMVIEDDILVTNEIFENVFQFDTQFEKKDIFLPNRIEIVNNQIFCVDTTMVPGTQGPSKTFQNREIKVFRNPHSGIGIFRSDKYIFSREKIDVNYRGLIVGGYMASAFAHYHTPFNLYRVCDGLDYHTVLHVDHWKPRSIKARARHLLNKFKFPSIG